MEDWHILDNTIMRLIEDRYARNTVSKWWDIDQKCRGFAHKMRKQNSSPEFIGAFFEIWDAVREVFGGSENKEQCDTEFLHDYQQHIRLTREKKELEHLLDSKNDVVGECQQYVIKENERLRKENDNLKHDLKRVASEATVLSGFIRNVNSRHNKQEKGETE